MEPFHYTLRVYWEDTDAGGIVYHANYLKYFERARTEWLRSLGINQQEMREQEHTQLVVSNMQIDYLSSARLDDELLIRTEALKIGRASITLQQSAHYSNNSDAAPLCQAIVKIGCVDATTLKPVRFSNLLTNTLKNV